MLRISGILKGKLVVRILIVRVFIEVLLVIVVSEILVVRHLTDIVVHEMFSSTFGIEKALNGILIARRPVFPGDRIERALTTLLDSDVKGAARLLTIHVLAGK